MIDLISPKLWSSHFFPKHLKKVLLDAGYPEAECEKFLFLLEGHSQDVDSLLTSLSQSKDEQVSKIAKYITSVRSKNANCYKRNSREKSRVIQWPNNPKTLQNDPAHYFDIFEDLPWRNQYRWIDRNTPVVSMGSCFAHRIAHQLQITGYNYIIEEDDKPKDLPLEDIPLTNYRAAPVRMGTLFNVPSMRQVVEQAFGEWYPPDFAYQFHDKGWKDPFRSIPDRFNSAEELQVDRKNYTKALNRAFLKCDVAILTLGLTEAWQLSATGDYLSVSPWQAEPIMLRQAELSVGDNVRELERLYSVFRGHNPNIKLILSVSPVPLNKTFSTQNHVVAANMLSKSTLRVAAEELSRKYPDDVAYFPSYEVVLYGTQTPWEEDMRHVSSDAVGRVMQLFQKMFLCDQNPDSFKSVLAHTYRPELNRSWKGRAKAALYKSGLYSLIGK